MDFALSQDQQMLQSTARDFFLSQGLTAPARKVMEGETAAAEALWRQMGELGFLGVTVPADYGGSGLGVLSLVPILEEAGRVVAPGPLPEALGFAATVLAEAGSDAQKERYLGGLASGAEMISLAIYEADGDPVAGDCALAADRVAGGYRLRGRKRLVPHAAEASTLLVLARSGQGGPGSGLSLFAVDRRAAGLEIAPVPALDQSRPLYQVDFRDVAVGEDARIGPEDAGFALAERGFCVMAETLTAISVGGMQRCVDMSAEHAKNRIAFGHPIGRFQAIKHRIVDMWVDLETARSLSYYAAWALETARAPAYAGAVAAESGSALSQHAAAALEEGGGEHVTAVADAKAFTSQAFVRVAASNIQNHGGMGFTWEADPHLYLKRAKSWENYIGSPQAQLEIVASGLGW
jgi:alkylation response protein AidB-like acyl-CoA dehydrogenase